MNTTWMKTDFNFGLPLKEFTIGLRQVMVMCRLRDGLRVRQDDPASAEEFVKSVVEFYRPELKGGSVVLIEFRSMSWKIIYTHPSFPKQMEGMSSLDDTSEPLIPSEMEDTKGPTPIYLPRELQCVN